MAATNESFIHAYKTILDATNKHKAIKKALPEFIKEEQVSLLYALGGNNVPKDANTRRTRVVCAWIEAAKLGAAQSPEFRELMLEAIAKRFTCDRSKRNFLDQAANLEDDDEVELACALVTRFTCSEDELQDQLKGFIENGALASAVVLCLTHNDTKKATETLDLVKRAGTPLQYSTASKYYAEKAPRELESWLGLVRKHIVAADYESARKTLASAFMDYKNNEQILLMAIRLEIDCSEYDRAFSLAEKAMRLCPTENVWVQWAKLELRRLNDIQVVSQKIADGLAKFPASEKLHLMRITLTERYGTKDELLAMVDEAVLAAPNSYRLAIKHAEKHANYVSFTRMCSTKHEALKTRVEENPTSGHLIARYIKAQTELFGDNSGNDDLSGLMENCVEKGPIHWQLIKQTPAENRLKRIEDALKELPDDPYVLTAYALSHWDDSYEPNDIVEQTLRKITKTHPKYGDAWALLYEYYCVKFQQAFLKQLVRECGAASPDYGHVWEAVNAEVIQWSSQTKAILSQAGPKAKTLL